MNINKINSKNQVHKLNSYKKHFTKCGQFSTILTPLKKTGVSRGKLNDLQMANSSTPLNRAFFIRNLRTPKINLAIDLFSMVERKGQPLAVGCLPFVAVFHPFTFYRPTVESLAVDMKNLQMGLSQMLYKFMLLGKNRLKLSIRANTEQQARQLLNLNQQNALLIARINDKGGLYV
ncbi:ash family protein [Histophilus somni]|uniref:ash family protein n=1 Tax=Histophilus somni TaxID=731 RepID=UPI00201F2EE3|nr:ash family protein [Histophilus somni]